MSGLWAALGPVLKLLVEALLGAFMEAASRPDSAEIGSGWDEKQVSNARARIIDHFSGGGLRSFSREDENGVRP